MRSGYVWRLIFPPYFGPNCQDHKPRCRCTQPLLMRLPVFRMSSDSESCRGPFLSKLRSSPS